MDPRDTIRSDGETIAVAPPPAGLDESFAERYRPGPIIGQGGMGEVRLCRDTRIGRSVAVKVIRTGARETSDDSARFLREARIQGQLEHPAIVPVYDLGRDVGGTPYFTMKRVHGITLARLLSRLTTGDAEVAAEYTRRKLLTAFSSICLALDYAHGRDVVHRDLKPANIMLGHFGEVYLLDWGLARVATEPDEASRTSGVSVAPGQTGHGVVLGTPNYMAPEQVRGELQRIGPRSDVYSLGAILFEILTLVPVCTGVTAAEMLAETLHGVDTQASARTPHREIPPELDAICARALRLEPDERYSSARELSQAVERFLDGDRDLALRRELAAHHADRARRAADTAVADDHNLEARQAALREVGRALALDADNAAALATFVRLLTRPPAQMPAAAEREMLRDEQQRQQATARIRFWAFASWFFYLPLVLWMGVKDWTVLMLAAPLWLGAAWSTWNWSRTPGSAGHMPTGQVALVTLAIGSTAVMFGPFVLLPAITTANIAIFFMLSSSRIQRPTLLLAAVMTILLPLALEATGLLPASLGFDGGAVTLHSLAFELPPIPTKLFLLVTNLSVVVTAGVVAARVRDRLTASERQVHLQAWQLRQLVPETGRMGVSPLTRPT